MKDIQRALEVKQQYNKWLGDAVIKKEHARFLWTTDEDGKIDLIIIASFENEGGENEVELHKPSLDPQYLYDYFTHELGSGYPDHWKTTNIYRVVIDLLLNYEFANHDVTVDFLTHELHKIQEVREDAKEHYKLWKE